MSLAKIVIAGAVARNPEKRFTSNNIAVTTFYLDYQPEKQLLKVVSTGKQAELIADKAKTGTLLIIDGSLQTIKEGEKTIPEIKVSSIQFLDQPTESTEEYQDDLIGEDEIPF